MPPTEAPPIDSAKTLFEERVSALPDDSALPGLRSIRMRGLAETLPELNLGGGQAVIRMCNHHPGERAAIEVRAANRRFAIKFYADDPAAEAEVYQRLAVEGLAGDSGPRVPRLLGWDRDRKILVLSWLEGPSADRLVKNGKGSRAGELAAEWLRAASTRDVKIGPPRSGGYALYRVGMSVGALTAADAALGTTAKRTAVILVRTQPEGEGTPRLVHGTLYSRHIFDMGDGPGVIDWQQSGQGPLEVDAGMFLATISRVGIRHKESADDATRATEAFIEGTRGLLDPNVLEWYWAASLLHLAARSLKTGLRPQPTLDASSVVGEAERRAERLET